MKAKPLKLIGGEYFYCSPEEATHVKLNMPGPIPTRYLRVILSGSRDEHKAWTWNGDTEKPTLWPSVLSETARDRCHTWVNDGIAKFLDDCSHELAGQSFPLFDVEMPQ